MYESTIGLAGYQGRSIDLPFRLPRDCTISIAEDIDGLRSLKSDWNHIADAHSVEPWQSFSWMEAAAVAYNQDHQLRVITVRKNGKLTAIAPMVLRPAEQPLHPIHLDFLGGEKLKEPNRLIYSDKDSLDLLLDVIVSEPVYPIRLSRIQNDDLPFAMLLEKFKRAGWITKFLHMPYSYIDLRRFKIKKSLKEDLRRARKKAKALGKTEFKLICGFSEDNLAEHLATGFHIEASGWKGRNNTAILCHAPRKEFFERYAHASLRDRTLRLCFLLINDQPVAVQYAIEAMNAYWLLNIGYDEQFRACSPGNILLYESIKSAAESGLARYNLLGKEEAWVQRWTQTTQDSYILAAYRPNFYGVRAIVSDALALTQRHYKNRKKKAHKKNITCAIEA